jgi:RND superfamily putative drug exporter
VGRLLAIPAGRRAKWVVFFTWMVVVFGSSAAQLPTKFQDAEKNDAASFLPGDAESTKALEQTKRLQSGELAPMVVIFRREGGLTAADRARIAALVERFNRERARLAADGKDPFRRTTPLRKGPETRDAVLYTATINADTGQSETILDPVEKAREILSHPGGRLEAKVTGAAGFSADAIKVFEGINGTLLLAAGGLVFVLLILIYRSPFFFWIPLLCVAFAEITSRSVGWVLTEAGVTVNGQSSSILSVLVLGAGTDYALLLVSRYREELHTHEDKHEALARALRTAGPAIVASALTVSAALLCLSIAKVNGTAGLGPIGAIGIAVALITMITLLPAALAIFGRRAFWPLIPYGPAGSPPPGWVQRIPLVGRLEQFGRRWEVRHRADETHGFWRRIGDRVARRPRRVWIGTGIALVVCALGLLDFNTKLTQTDAYRDQVESVEGQKLLAKSFPAGANAPADVIVPDRAKAPAVAAALERVPGVAAVLPAPGVRPDAREALLSVVLEYDAYSNRALELVPTLRQVARRAGGPGVLVGGATAIQKDLTDAAWRDTKLIVPIVLLVVLLILIALLRALVAPVLLTLTVILSFFASLGVGAIVFDVVFGFPGSDPSLPLFAFVFLVALGIDYNIFLMARVREETLRHDTRDGMLRGLAVTGGVITSAGIVLAGTFSVLAVLPLVFLTEIGFVIAFGVLLDTFVVRSVLVPALVLDLGDRIWWPSALARRRDRTSAG